MPYTTLQILKELVQKVKSRKLSLLLFALLVTVPIALIVNMEKPTYAAYSKIFPLSINKANGSSPLDAIKSQFGISDKTDYDKIYNVHELVTSKTISHKIVKSPTNNKRYTSLSKWIIDDYNKNIQFWKKKIKLEPKDSNILTYAASGLFLEATEIKLDEKTGFTRITTTFHDKELSKEVNETILTSLSDYYISLVTEKPRYDLITIQILRDSLKNELYGVERAIAGFQDANQMSVKYAVNIPQAKLLRTRAEVEQLYAVTVTAFQNARFKLLSESPIFQVLDMPGEPYVFKKTSTVKVSIIVFIGCIFIACLWVCRKIFWRLIVAELSKT